MNAALPLTLLLVFMMSGHAHGDTPVNVCPEGHKDGETWYTKDCRQHYCRDNSYGYSYCGDYTYDNKRPDCYVTRDDTKNFPDCCKPVLVCRGDKGFDESKLKN